MVLVNGPWLTPPPVGWNDAPDPQAYAAAGDPGGFDEATSIGGSAYFATKTVGSGPVWTSTELAGFYDRSLTDQGFANPFLGRGLWTTDYASWPTTPSQDGTFFQNYDWRGLVYIGGHEVKMPSLLAFRTKVEKGLVAIKQDEADANPTATPTWVGLEWESPSDFGALVSVALRVYEHLNPGESVTRDRRGATVANTSAVSGTSVRLLNAAHIDGPPVTPATLGNDPAAPNPELFAMPTLAPGGSGFGEHALDLGQLAPFMLQGQGHAGGAYTDNLGVQRFVVTTAGRSTSVYDFGEGRSAFTLDTSVRTRVSGHVEAWVVYQPPRYRYVYRSDGTPPANATEDPWLRALQRTDGLGAGGPPRATQQAMRTDSLRAGTAAI